MRLLLLVSVTVSLAAGACGDIVDDTAPGPTVTEAAKSRDVVEPVGEPDPAAAPTESALQPTSGETAATEAPTTTGSDPESAERNPAPEQVPVTSTAAPVTGETDGGLVAEIMKDLVDRTGAADSDIIVVRSEEVIWNDGSLGCPVPGEMYTQAVVNGYWIVLEHGGQTYDYRATDTGYFRLCEGFVAPPSNPTG